MQQHKTTIKQDHFKQWVATTYIPLTEPENRQLCVTTQKSSRGYVYTSAQAVKVSGTNEHGFSGISFTMFQDYNAQVKSYPDVKRVTSAAVTKCHNDSLKIIDEFVKLANEFYNKTPAEQLQD